MRGGPPKIPGSLRGGVIRKYATGVCGGGGVTCYLIIGSV